ncbi:MAG: hypothetical protein N4A57_07995 [Anaeromicrobium sp.]|jgi:hypothetical protein|uniref:hypothetical protein n=1 Tax=Anaeromicrobium sp. TaxID=1929132 RepID=UPI0025D935A5|nr:hypothetical protein [Anaeromicrobium sp.]MCT4594192.1 hypothetical protein [Anaeromicrobium sp.]
MLNLNFQKETSKALFYEIGEYRIRIPKQDYYVIRNSSNEKYASWDDEQDFLPACDVKIENIKTKDCSIHRCYQPFGILLEDLRRDYNSDKSQFRWK